MKLLRALFGTKHERDIKIMMPVVKTINSLEDRFKSLSDTQLKEYFNDIKQQYQQSQQSLKSFLPEVFAIVREASSRTLQMRHFDVQLIGGMVLFNGKIAEMKTGEGKTLVATLTAALRSIKGKGVHIVTVNDHLAKRDAQWMGPIYTFFRSFCGSGRPWTHHRSKTKHVCLRHCLWNE